MNRSRAVLRLRRRLKVTLDSGRTAMTADVSWKGFAAEMPDPVLPGTFIEGVIEYGTETHPFRAIVAWSKPGNRQLNTKDRFGARFTESSPELMSLLSAPGGARSRWRGIVPRGAQAAATPVGIL